MTRFRFLTILLMIMATGACAGPGAYGVNDKLDSPSGSAVPLHLFRTYLSGADGHRCPMTPSCSSYALSAIKRHGALMGWIMTVDRLMRCGRDELTHSPAIRIPEGVHCLDTVENNDFWWD